MSVGNLLTFRNFSIVVLVALIATSKLTLAQSELVKRLKTGRSQTLVVYGTSLTYSKGGNAWLDSVVSTLNGKYGNYLKSVNGAKGGQGSIWGVQSMEDSVIKKNPDAVMIEFGINDAYLAKNISLQLARLNLNYMIDRILIENPKCEIILQVMNMPVGKSAEIRPKLSSYYDIYRDVARERKLLLIDHYPNWERLLNQGMGVFLSYVPDGIHPNPEGARKIIAPYILQRLEEGRR